MFILVWPRRLATYPSLDQGWTMAARTGMLQESTRQGLAEKHLCQAVVGLGSAEEEKEAGEMRTLVAGPYSAPLDGKECGALSLISEPTWLPLPVLTGEGTAALNGAGNPKAALHPFPWVPGLPPGGLAFCLRSVRSRR